MTPVIDGRRPVRVFAAATGNQFMLDIASWLAEAAALTGRPAEVVADGTLPAGGATLDLVVAPHEFYTLHHADDSERHAAARCSVPVCTEQPGTKWFEMTTLLVEASPIVLDINQHGVDALNERGIAARHLRLGGVPSMDRRSFHGERDIDALFLGGMTDHRAAALADLAPVLWNRTADIRLFDFSRPVRDGVAGLVFGTDKYDLLARSRLLVNVHRDGNDGGYFEWARMVEAMANGCAIVSEPSAGHGPLVPGVHLVETDDMAAAVCELLEDPATCRRIGDAAAHAVLDEFALVDSIGPILDELDDSTPRTATAAGHPTRRTRVPRYRARLQRAQQMPLLPAFRPDASLRRRVGDALHAEVALRRRLDATECDLLHGDPHHITTSTTSAWDDRAGDAEVSVIVTVFNYASVVTETLDSIVASDDVDLEIVVIDDHSTDDGRRVVGDFMSAHDDVAMLLLGCDSNRGLPAARNLAIEHARADKIMVMDADNHVYPTCLHRLAAALDEDPDAAFSWSILEEFGTERGLRSAVGWHVPWLCAANNIDAQAMLRSSVLAELGGYRTGDALVFGWEDWDLWLRIAASGGHGVHVRQILGRYRRQEQSMLATSNLFSDVMYDHLRDLYPSLPWPA